MSLLQCTIKGPIEQWTKKQLQDFIAAVEADMRTLPEIEIPVEHRFSEGVYAREVQIPADSVVIGKIHKHRNLNVVLEGEISVISIDGVKRFKAGDVMVSSPGVKRLVYAHTPVRWMTIHGTHETDLAKIEEQFIAKSYEEVVPWLG